MRNVYLDYICLARQHSISIYIIDVCKYTKYVYTWRLRRL